MTERLGCFLLGLVLLSGVSTAAAQDPDRDRARGEFERGVERYGAGDYQGALDAFQEAYRLAPHPSVRVNMANCYEQLDRPLEAIFHYERFAAELPNAPAAQRREVTRALERLSTRVGEVTLHVLPDGANVVFDGDETRRSPITEAITMTAGSHSLEVSLDGYETVRREFIVEGGQPAQVDASLVRQGAAGGDPSESGEVGVATTEETAVGDPAEGAEGLASADTPSEPPPPADEPRGGGGGIHLSTPVIISGAATGALLIATIITGSLALGAQSDFDDAVVRSNDSTLTPFEREVARADGLDAKDRTDSLALVTDILLVGTLLGAGATAFFFLTQEEEGGDRAHAGPRLTASPVATPRGAGLVLDGTF